MKKKILLLLFVALVYGTLFGVIMIEDNQTDYVIYMAWGYPLILIGALIYVNKYFKRTGFAVYIYPLFAILMYVPTNVLSGMYFGPGLNYYYSFARYDIVPYYILFLITLYLLARGINTILKSRYGKIIFIVTDILSLTALPFLLIATYFVSPH